MPVWQDRAARSPRLFTVEPGVPFLKTVAAALCDGRLVEGFELDRDDPLALARATLYVPTRRAARALRSEFVDHLGTGSAILPVIRPLGEADEDSSFFDEAEAASLDLLPPIGGVDALLELASLIQRWKTSLPETISGFHLGSPLIAPASPADAVWLARGLVDLLDAMETHSCPWERLDRLAAADYAEWWQLTLEFLKIASSFWPARLAELSRMSSAGHRNAVLAAETARLKNAAPRGPVVVAGSTGSVPATAELMAAIAGHEQGAIVFPGLDHTISEAVWPLVGGAADGGRVEPATLTHPQYGLFRLLERLGVRRDAVKPLEAAEAPLSERNRLVSAALLPARATDLWAEVKAGPGEAIAAFESVSLIEAAGEREEALAIAVAMRTAGDDPKARVALVTPDRNLARRVAVELHRFGIEANDSAGVPLAATPQATLVRLLLDAVMQPGDPVALSGLLNHPLARFGLDAASMREAAHAFELLALRGTIGEVDIAALRALLDESIAAHRGSRHAPQWRRRLKEKDVAAARRLAENIERMVRPLTGRFVRFADGADEGRLTDRAPVADWARETAHVLEEIVRDEAEGLAGLWGGEAGEMLAGIFASVIDSRTALTANGAEWADILAALLAGETVKPRLTVHPRIFIWGALEARLQDVDTIVLAGLNEGGWPGQTANDPFLSRAMKIDMDLEPPERRIGLAAHDFQMAMGTRNVVLSRALKADKAPTVASRWLQRLLVVAGDEAAGAMRRRGQVYLGAADRLDHRPPTPLARRPEPKPAKEHQPKRYSFSEVRTLRRDPYAVYARRVLKLDPLAELIRDPGVAERGTLYHAILEDFTRAKVDVDRLDALDILERVGAGMFEEARLPEHIDVVWRPRFLRIAALFIDWERRRAGEVVSRFTEAKAEIPVSGTEILLGGMADRIDLLKDGSAEIIDYKSGSSPSRREARALLDPQLPLEAAALMRGGFGEIGVLTPSSLKYVRLKGAEALPVDCLEGFDKTNAQKDDGSNKSAVDLADNALEQLARLVEALASGRHGFASRIIPASARDFGGDYDHLARVAEWATADDDDALNGGEGA